MLAVAFLTEALDWGFDLSNPAPDLRKMAGLLGGIVLCSCLPAASAWKPIRRGAMLALIVAIAVIPLRDVEARSQFPRLLAIAIAGFVFAAQLVDQGNAVTLRNKPGRWLAATIFIPSLMVYTSYTGRLEYGLDQPRVAVESAPKVWRPRAFDYPEVHGAPVVGDGPLCLLRTGDNRMQIYPVGAKGTTISVSFQDFSPTVPNDGFSVRFSPDGKCLVVALWGPVRVYAIKSARDSIGAATHPDRRVRTLAG